MPQYQPRPNLPLNALRGQTIDATAWSPGADVPGACTCQEADAPHVHSPETGGTTKLVLLEDGDVVAKLPNGYHVWKPDVFARLFVPVDPTPTPAP